MSNLKISCADPRYESSAYAKVCKPKFKSLDRLVSKEIQLWMVAKDDQPQASLVQNSVLWQLTDLICSISFLNF